MKVWCLFLFFSQSLLNCAGNYESRIDFSFDERAKYQSRSNSYTYTNKMNEFPGFSKLYDSNKKLKFISLYYPKLRESIEIINNKISKIEYYGQKGNELNFEFSYEEACEIVREYNWDMSESITLEDCYGFWGKYARRLGLVETKKGY